MTDQDNKKWQFSTRLVHGGTEDDPTTGATVTPIYQTASFAHETAEEISDIFNNRQFGYTYSRIANPTVDSFEHQITAIEEGRGSIAVASGMAANAIVIQSLVETGDEILVAKSLFGGTYYLVNELRDHHGITVKFVDTTDIAAYKAAITDQTKLIFCETIGNPKIDVPDIKALATVANNANIPLIVDSTTTTAHLIDLKALGVSICIQAATKWLSGNGSTIGGVITDLGNYKWKDSKSRTLTSFVKKVGELGFIARCKKLRSNLGASLSPFNAYLLSLGLPTLSLRLTAQCENALKVATFLNEHPRVKAVQYPGLKNHPDHDVCTRQFNGKYGGLLAFQLESKEHCFKMINNLNMIKNLANLGDVKTLIIHPESTIYRDMSTELKEEAGAYTNLIRLSLGIESSEDIIQDLNQALENI